MPQQPQEPGRPRRLARRAALLGAVLAVLCHTVPEEYRELCHAVAQVCNPVGGLL